MRSHCVIVLCASVIAFAHCHASLAQDVRRIPLNGTNDVGTVVVGDVPLIHTEQVFAPDTSEAATKVRAEVQTSEVISKLKTLLADAKAQHLVKLNVYALDQAAIDAARPIINQKFDTANRPAVSYVVTKLPIAGAFVAMDAVATADSKDDHVVRHPPLKSSWATVPAGSRIYISGQAEPGANLDEMTRRTLTSLRETLKWLERSDEDIAQLKVFVQPMAKIAEVHTAFKAVFGDQVPPTVHVEWLGKESIEIELVAWGGKTRKAPNVEYLTPPFMKPSPVFCRVTRINQSPTIFVSGLYASTLQNAPGATSLEGGEREVKEIFATLESLLKDSGSDLRHLVKATYYCETDTASKKLNELRPKYYPPERPPAASKAMISGVGRAGLGLTLDMIAVPSSTK